VPVQIAVDLQFHVEHRDVIAHRVLREYEERERTVRDGINQRRPEQLLPQAELLPVGVSGVPWRKGVLCFNLECIFVRARGPALAERAVRSPVVGLGVSQ